MSSIIGRKTKHNWCCVSTWAYNIIMIGRSRLCLCLTIVAMSWMHNTYNCNRGHNVGHWAFVKGLQRFSKWLQATFGKSLQMEERYVAISWALQAVYFARGTTKALICMSIFGGCGYIILLTNLLSVTSLIRSFEWYAREKWEWLGIQCSYIESCIWDGAHWVSIHSRSWELGQSW